MAACLSRLLSLIDSRLFPQLTTLDDTINNNQRTMLLELDDGKQPLRHIARNSRAYSPSQGMPLFGGILLHNGKLYTLILQYGQGPWVVGCMIAASYWNHQLGAVTSPYPVHVILSPPQRCTFYGHTGLPVWKCELQGY